MAFALKSKSQGKTHGTEKPASKRKSARGQRSADTRSGYEMPVFQPLTAAPPIAPVIQAKLKTGEPTHLSHGGILQHKCACGGAAGISGGCEECGKKQRLSLQTKLKVNEPGDAYEQEADRIADQVMAAPASPAVSGAPLRIQRFSGQSNGQMGAAPASVDRALASPGRPLESALRQNMEQRFGYDFSRVRVHTDTSAAESTHTVNARAYTVGGDIVFGREQYAPGTSEGKRLVAHELTHVVQQLGGNYIPAGLSDVKRATSSCVRQADTVADNGGKQIPNRPATASMAVLQGNWKDDLADEVAHELDDYVTSNTMPYKHVIETVHFFESKELDDNVAADFTELQSLARLEKFAATREGREMLDVLYEAMITGDVSEFERLQADRILYAKWKWMPSEAYRTQRLRDPAVGGPAERAIELKASEIAQDLNDDVAKNLYREVITKFKRQDSYIEDDVASRFLVLQSPDKLEKFAADDEGRAMLDVLYEALITGDVTDFERLQAERIFTAKAKRKPSIPTKEYLRQLAKERVMIFPVRNIGITKNCIAVFKAALTPEGKVRVVYDNMDPWQCDMFKEEADTLPQVVKPYEKGLDLDPDKIVMVKLYDQGDYIDTAPALKLIDYANQIKKESIGKIAEVTFLAATFGTGALSGAAVRGLAAEVAAGRASATALTVAKGLLWADRVAMALPAVSLVVNEHRDWFRKTRAGRFLLAALDRANSIATYYGWARMGVEGARFIKAKLGPAWKEWRTERAALKEKLSQSEQNLVKGVDNEIELILNEAEKAEKEAGLAAVKYVEEHPNVVKPGKPGERRAKVGDHEVAEVKVEGGIHCEYRSSVTVVDCPKQWTQEPQLEPSKASEPHKIEKPAPSAAKVDTPAPVKPTTTPTKGGASKTSLDVSDAKAKLKELEARRLELSRDIKRQKIQVENKNERFNDLSKQNISTHGPEINQAKKRLNDETRKLAEAERRLKSVNDEINATQRELAKGATPWREARLKGIDEDARVGLYSELETTTKLQQKEWERMGNTINPDDIRLPGDFEAAVKSYRGKKGLDGLFRRTKNGEVRYLVPESKGTLDMTARKPTGSKGKLESTANGVQGSHKWIRENLKREKLSVAERAEIETALKEGRVDVVYAHTTPSGTRFYKLDHISDTEVKIGDPFDP